MDTKIIKLIWYWNQKIQISEIQKPYLDRQYRC